MHYILLPYLLHLVSGVDCSLSQLQSVVDPKTWLSSWRSQCSSHVATSSVVSNKHVCHQLLLSCSDCCIAGYDRVSRECHVLRAEPLGIVTLGRGSMHCPQRCGTPGNVTTAWKDCGSLGVINKGSITIRPGIQGGTSFGAEAIFTCQTGYFVNVTTLVCGATGWNAPKPSCQVVDCGTPRTPNNGSKIVSATTYGNYVIYYCGTGYFFKGYSQSQTYLLGSCTANGTWSVENPQCERKYCPVLLNITNGWVNTSQGIQYQDVATYHCAEGYYLSGAQQLTCRSYGSWNNNTPTCQVINCPSLSTSSGSFSYSSGLFVTGQTTVGSTATVTCNSGYYVSSGDANRTCQANSSWTGSAPVCSYRCGISSIFNIAVDDDNMCLKIYYSGHQYLWSTARSACETQSARLAQIDTPTKTAAAMSLLSRWSSRCSYRGWIGLSFNTTMAAHTWLDGSIFDTSALASNAFSNTDGQLYPVVWFFGTGQFFGSSATQTWLCMICEYPAAP